MPIEIFWAIAGGALLLAAISLFLLAIAGVRLAGEARGVLRSASRLLVIVEAEVPATLRHLRIVADNLRQVSTELEPRLQRTDALLDEADATLAALRSSFEATEAIIRGPFDAVARATRGVSSVETWRRLSATMRR